MISVGEDLFIGAGGTGGQVVAPSEADFVSIANFSDVDYYSFTVSSPVRVNATLTPLGGIFTQGPVGGTETVFDANRRSNLALALLADDGTTLLRFANDAAAGSAEAISELAVPAAGTYLMRVTGSSTHVQLYQLQLSATALPPELSGDYNHDGAVDAGDFVVWRKAMGQSGLGLSADGNQDGTVDEGDYDVWRVSFGQVADRSMQGSVSHAHVPEPPLLVSVVVAGLVLFVGGRRGR
jgi:hypothetical protein